MRTVLFTIASVMILLLFIQIPTAEPALSLYIWGSSIERMPLPEGRAGAEIIRASGNVVITTTGGQRVTAESLVWISDSHVIDLNGGSARVELPGPPTSVHIEQYR
jgi:hypothetical protein